MKTDPRIDAYIERQQDFAKPILRHLRDVVHVACPEAEETLKWSMPTFIYRGEILANMAAFKQHASFGFWRGSLLKEKDEAAMEGMGQFGRITALEDLPPRAELETMVQEAMALTEAGVKPVRNKHEKPPYELPDDLREALAAQPAAQKVFDGFPPSAQRDYVDWIVEAKRTETRRKRLDQAMEWIGEGKRRHWKYEKC